MLNKQTNNQRKLMSDSRDELKAMLQDLINDRPEQAEQAIHNYLVQKTQEVSGLGSTALEQESGE
jgi:ribosomal protein L16 Arg81 hydroxylase